MGSMAESIDLLAHGDVYVGWLWMMASVCYGAFWAQDL